MDRPLLYSSQPMLYSSWSVAEDGPEPLRSEVLRLRKTELVPPRGVPVPLKAALIPIFGALVCLAVGALRFGASKPVESVACKATASPPATVKLRATS